MRPLELVFGNAAHFNYQHEMTANIDIMISATLNMLVFGGIIYGTLARSKGKPLAARLAILIPLAANLAGLIFKSQFVLEQRVIGFATALVLAVLLFILAKRRGLFSPAVSPTHH
tara:strand:+ start:103 stop:447 length:345 start_codon:yes stop_codon:yes gene_type:complete